MARQLLPDIRARWLGSVRRLFFVTDATTGEKAKKRQIGRRAEAFAAFRDQLLPQFEKRRNAAIVRIATNALSESGHGIRHEPRRASFERADPKTRRSQGMRRAAAGPMARLHEFSARIAPQRENPRPRFGGPTDLIVNSPCRLFRPPTLPEPSSSEPPRPSPLS